MLFKDFKALFQTQEVSDIATGNILTTTSSSYADVPGLSFSTSNARNGDIIIICASFVVRADSGSTGRAIITVVDNGTPFDVAATERTSDNAGTFLYASVVAQYTIANGPSSGSFTTTVKIRGKRTGGAGNAYVSSPCNIVALYTRTAT